MIIVLTPEQAALLRAGDTSRDGVLPPVPMNTASYFDLCGVAAFTGLGGMRITPAGRNSVHWHDAQRR